VLTVRGPLGALPPGAREAWTDLGRGRRSPRRRAHARAAGLRPLEAQVGAVARRRRIVVPDAAAPATAEGALRAEAGLTWRELEILRHLAAGETSRRIAERLVLSERTVGHHVSSILRKLGVDTRGQAASVAHRTGLEPVGYSPQSQ
jgi:DNA-binding NarL/FixJ family response regulator